MNSCKQRIINERSISIPIQQSSPTNKKADIINEYSLTQNCFDPFKSSPPNEFMLKLNLRLKHHGFCIKDDKRSME
jgi:hypothetical protein